MNKNPENPSFKEKPTQEQVNVNKLLRRRQKIISVLEKLYKLKDDQSKKTIILSPQERKYLKELLRSYSPSKDKIPGEDEVIQFENFLDLLDMIEDRDLDDSVKTKLEKTKEAYLQNLGVMLEAVISKLEEELINIESNPEVINKLREEAEKDLERFRSTLESFYQRITGYCKEIDRRHDVCFRKLEELTGLEKVRENTNNQKFSEQLKTRILEILDKAIIEGKIKDLGDLIPWYMKGIHHGNTLAFLTGKVAQEEILRELIILNTGNQQRINEIEKIKTKIQSLQQEADFLRRLFSTELITEIKEKIEMVQKGYLPVTIVKDNKRHIVFVQASIETSGKNNIICVIKDIQNPTQIYLGIKKGSTSVIKMEENKMIVPQFPQNIKEAIETWLNLSETKEKIQQILATS